MSRGGSRGKVRPSLADLSRKALSSAELKAWQDEIVGGNDRSAVLVASAYLDHVLRAYISSHFAANLSTSEAHSLFEDIGAPLGTFNGRILVAYALGAYDATTRDELHVIRRVRNACAHSPRPLSFSDPLILSETLLLREPTIEIVETSRRNSAARKRFSARCVEIAYRVTEATVVRTGSGDALLQYIGSLDDGPPTA